MIKSHIKSNSGFEVHCGLFPTHILLQLISPWGQPLACSLHSGFCRSTALVVLHSSNSFRLHRQNPTLEIKTLNNQFVEQKHLQFPMLLLLMQKVLWLPSALNSIIPVFYPHEISFLDQINFPGIFNFSCVFFFRKCAHCNLRYINSKSEHIGGYNHFLALKNWSVSLDFGRTRTSKIISSNL